MRCHRSREDLSLRKQSKINLQRFKKDKKTEIDLELAFLSSVLSFQAPDPEHLIREQITGMHAFARSPSRLNSQGEWASLGMHSISDQTISMGFFFEFPSIIDSQITEPCHASNRSLTKALRLDGSKAETGSIEHAISSLPARCWGELWIKEEWTCDRRGSWDS